MAIYASNNAYFSLGTYDLSAVTTNLSLNINYDPVEITAMNDTAHKFVKGLASHTISGTLFLDQIAIGTGATRAVLDSLKGTSAAFIIQPAGATASATNPKYTGSCFVNGYTPVNGGIDEVASVDFTFDVTTDITIAYA
jgi:hypothetical protein